MYVELITFKRGSFLKRMEPFFSRDAYTVYDKAVLKYSKLPDQEVMICLRHDNHILVKSWVNVKEQPRFATKLKEARGSRR